MSNWSRKKLLDQLVAQRVDGASEGDLRVAANFYRNFGYARVAFQGVPLEKHESRYIGRRLEAAANRIAANQ